MNGVIHLPEGDEDMYSDEEIRKHVGSMIHTFRRQRDMTLDELADAIYKSKSTVSKYESGKVGVTIEVLYEIAEVLDVPVHQLILMPEDSRSKNQAGSIVSGLFERNEAFLYYYDGRYKKVMKSYMRLVPNEVTGETEVFYYLGVKEFQHYQRCDYIYKGVMKAYDVVVYFYLKNLVNPVDQMTISILNPLGYRKTVGVLTGLLESPAAIYMTKVIFSKEYIEDIDINKERLFITPTDLEDFKKLNLFVPRLDKNLVNI